jgi:nicotinamidase-related amidase
MAVTTLDPNTALIVIDLQKGIASLPTVHPIDDVVARARGLIDAFRRRGLPVALVNVDGVAPGRTEQARVAGPFADGWTDLLPELGSGAGDIVVTKRTWGAFASTQVVVCGVATGTGVESTARQAYELGFNVTLAIDAMTDTRADAHDHSIAKVFPRLGESGQARDIIALLDRLSAGAG